MIHDRIRHRLASALDVEPMDPALRARIVASMPIYRPRAQSSAASWVPQVIAAALVVAVVAGLVFIGRAQRQQTASVPFACRLPVTNANRTASGFLSLPDGKYTPANGYGITYDAALGIWLPVPSSWVAPNGRAFAYVNRLDATGGIVDTAMLHIVDAVTRSDTVWLLPQSGAIIRWNVDGIYFNAESNAETLLINPATGESHPIGIKTRGQGTWWTEVQNGYAWGLTFPGGYDSLNSAPFQLMRLDLSTGEASPWYTSQTELRLLGLDLEGRAILIEGSGSSDGSGRPIAVLAQNKAVHLGTADQIFSWDQIAIADSHGYWFSGAMGGIWLYTPAGGLRRVKSESPADMVAGPCI